MAGSGGVREKSNCAGRPAPFRWLSNDRFYSPPTKPSWSGRERAAAGAQRLLIEDDLDGGSRQDLKGRPSISGLTKRRARSQLRERRTSVRIRGVRAAAAAPIVDSQVQLA